MLAMLAAIHIGSLQNVPDRVLSVALQFNLATRCFGTRVVVRRFVMNVAPLGIVDYSLSAPWRYRTVAAIACMIRDCLPTQEG